MATLAMLAAISAPAWAQDEPPLVFGADAGLVLTFVSTDRTTEFEQAVSAFRAVLEASEDPIRRQQAESWRIFRSPDPGPAGAALYVGFMQPVLRGADYRIARILREELDEEQAEALIATLTTALSQPQSTLDLDLVLDLEAPLDAASAERP